MNGDHHDADHHDEGLQFDVGTIFTRRRMLGLAVGASAAAFLAACGGDSSASSASTAAVATGATTAAAAGTPVPEETAGPFPGDGSNGVNALSQSGIVRSDIRSSFGGASGTADGIPIDLAMTIVDAATGKAAEGAAVYVWHCDAEGRYSMYSDGVTDQNYLRGVQVADASGLVKFTSVYPACYQGRWPHIHYEVYPSVDAITAASNKVATSQLALPDEANTAVYATSQYDGSQANYSRVSLATDMVFSDGTTNEVPTVTGSVSDGYKVAITSPIAF